MAEFILKDDKIEYKINVTEIEGVTQGHIPRGT